MRSNRHSCLSRICVVTAGHLSTCPRMLKAADAFAEAGHAVRVVSTRFSGWATEADAAVRRTRTWPWTIVDYDHDRAYQTWLTSGFRFHSAQAVARWAWPDRLPLALAARAFGRMHPELVDAALAEPADLFYGGTTGALAAVAVAAQSSGCPYAIDLEDFHTAEQEDGRGVQLAHALAGRLESLILPGAAFLTAGSAAIAEAYHQRYGVTPTPINNTFPLPGRQPDFERRPGAPLQLYWFSQTIGSNRGLEDAVRAAGLCGTELELHLRGNPVPGYLDSLEHLRLGVAPRLRMHHHAPVDPDAMVDSCRGYDIGLSLEEGHVLSRALCLTNKAFTYMLAGLAVALSDTPGQTPLARDIGDAACVYRPGDARALAAGLSAWANDPQRLLAARQASWAAATRRWHWEHPLERGALLAAVDRALGRMVPGN